MSKVKKVLLVIAGILFIGLLISMVLAIGKAAYFVAEQLTNAYDSVENHAARISKAARWLVWVCMLGLLFVFGLWLTMSGAALFGVPIMGVVALVVGYEVIPSWERFLSYWSSDTIVG